MIDCEAFSGLEWYSKRIDQDHSSGHGVAAPQKQDDESDYLLGGASMVTTRRYMRLRPLKVFASFSFNTFILGLPL